MRKEQEYKTYITCPYCRSKDFDSWERHKCDLETSWQEIECWDCGKKFRWKRGFEVWYNTRGSE